MSAFLVVWEVGGACFGYPLTNLRRVVGSGQRAAEPGLVVDLEVEVVNEDLSEAGILDFIQIREDVDLTNALPVAAEESRNCLRVDGI